MEGGREGGMDGGRDGGRERDGEDALLRCGMDTDFRLSGTSQKHYFFTSKQP